MGTTYVLDHSKLENTLDNLAFMVKQLAMYQTVENIGGICSCNDNFLDHWSKKPYKIQA